MMNANLQLKVIKSQQLISVLDNITIGYMTNDDPKSAFAARLNTLCDDNDIPPKGKNRQSIVGKMFAVSQEAARKWLEGESIPAYEKLLEMCNLWNVNIEWLFRGAGEKRTEYDVANRTPEAQVLKAMEHLTEAEKYQVLKITNTFAEPPQGNGTEK